MRYIPSYNNFRKKLIKMTVQSKCVKHVKQTVSLRIIQPLQMLILHHVFKSQYVYFLIFLHCLNLPMCTVGTTAPCFFRPWFCWDSMMCRWHHIIKEMKHEEILFLWTKHKITLWIQNILSTHNKCKTSTNDNMQIVLYYVILTFLILNEKAQTENREQQN